MKLRRVVPVVAIAAVSFGAGAIWAREQNKPNLESRIWSVADARAGKGDWGSLHMYTEDGTPSHGTDSVLTAEFEFLPGKRLQPPHQHAEEEFQYVIEGNGTWFLNGKESPLKAGDLMYSKPWDWHGIRNSSDKPMRFFVFKWKARGVAEPAKPDVPVPVDPVTGQVIGAGQPAR